MMIFLYSRKSQFVLLLCWAVGMLILYVQTTGEHPVWLAAAEKQISDHSQKARLGRAPQKTAPVSEVAPSPPPVSAPASVALPDADPVLNRCLAIQASAAAGERTDTLTLEIDYVAARTKGFTPEKTRNYYLEDAPVFVVALGEPWISDVKQISLPETLPQLGVVELIVSKSRHLRLLVHTRSMHVAKGAKLHISPTSTGMRAEIQLPR